MMRGAYTVYGFELSYFTRKVEAALRLHGLPFRRRSKTLLNWRRLERRSGCGKVPIGGGAAGFDSRTAVERAQSALKG